MNYLPACPIIDYRWMSAGLLAFSTTLALIVIMKNLVSSDQSIVDPDAYGPPIKWVRVPEMEPPHRSNRDIRRPEPPVDPPPSPPILFSKGETGFTVVGPVIGPGPERIHIGLVDGPPMATLQVQPGYPHAALRRGIEGYVIVEFDINKIGKVINPRVVENFPGPIFDRSALEAIQRFKYKPKVVDGQAQVVTGAFYRFTFELEKG